MGVVVGLICSSRGVALLGLGASLHDFPLLPVVARIVHNIVFVRELVQLGAAKRLVCLLSA